MNTSLLRLARRTRHGRFWIVPGFGNAVKLIRRSMWGVPALSWPARDDKGELVRTMRLDWHRHTAKAAMREILGASK